MHCENCQWTQHEKQQLPLKKQQTQKEKKNEHIKMEYDTIFYTYAIIDPAVMTYTPLLIPH